ncbi:helix-turn-helix transcriptional regulator [Clostridium butyricum]|uniref:helix-turn-helix transcriptional regulator n=1 Tax=Clostridium butyricum TaxID=1492 RepID=UPI00129B0E30|nr:helix-turn-helix transcriptional regulator [Clostridium butyricum]QGH20697.1 XRE family transcriptional regulator [Clostridium butyricum]QGH24738.1 XRE family transcriptional regulator [Clostridium butyricum]
MKNKIKELITKKGLKVMFVIEKVGLSTSSFYEIMNGKAVPSLKNARKIAEVLNVSLDELFPEEKFEEEN